jgi:hypothetical protein
LTEAPAAPLLSASAARVVVDGAVALDALELVTRGDLLVVAGDADPFFGLLSGMPLNAAEVAERARTGGELMELSGNARVASGAVSVAGRDVASGAHHAVVGFAPLDPPTVHDRHIGDYARESIRLALARTARPSRADVERRIAWALERGAISGGPKRRIGTLALPERRGFLVALAMAAGAEVLLADRPLLGLDGQAAAFVLGVLERVGAGRRTIMRVASLAPGTAEGDLARRATDVAVFAGSSLAFFGPIGARPAGERVYQVTVRSGGDALRAALAEGGLELGGGPVRYSLALPEGRRPAEILRAAASVRASVVEIIPLM